MKLSTDTAVFLMNDPGKLLIIGKAFFIKERFFKSTFSYGYITDNDHGTATGGDFSNFSKYSSSDQTECGRCEDDAVFQRDAP